MKFDLKIGNNKYPVSVYDIVLVLSFLWLMVLASPYVVSAFRDLKDFNDILWNLSLVFVCFNAALIVFLIIGSLLNTFDRWVARKKHQD